MSFECKEGEYTLNSEKYDEIKSMDEEGLDNHTDDILSKDAQTPILLMQEKKLEKQEPKKKREGGKRLVSVQRGVARWTAGAFGCQR